MNPIRSPLRQLLVLISLACPAVAHAQSATMRVVERILRSNVFQIAPRVFRHPVGSYGTPV